MNLKNRLKHLVSALLWPTAQKSTSIMEQSLLHVEYSLRKSELAAALPGNPAIEGYKVFSQGDEDGIIQAIISRIQNKNMLSNQVFVEIGAGSTGENNSSLLVTQGWRGVMLDADPGVVSYFSTDSAKNLVVLNEKLEPNSNLENVIFALENKFEIPRINLKIPIGLLSVDIDGFDLEIVSRALIEIDPDVLVLEYNASFPPPVVAKVTPITSMSWKGDNYYGASLQSWHDYLSPTYALVACGISGVNSFWVKNLHRDVFEEYTLEQLYQPARHHLTKMKWGHHPAAKKWINN